MPRGSSSSSAERISLKRRIVMKTIEERAREYASKKGDISLSAIYNEALANIYEEAYIAGAKEQNRIDIDKACKWVKKYTHISVAPEVVDETIGWLKEDMEDN